MTRPHITRRVEFQAGCTLVFAVLFALVLRQHGLLWIASKPISSLIHLSTVLVPLTLLSYTWRISIYTVTLGFLVSHVMSYRHRRRKKSAELRASKLQSDHIVLALPKNSENFFTIQQQSRPQPFVYPELEDVERELSELIDTIISSFINSWYSKITSRPLFPKAIEYVMRLALIATKERFSQMDIVGSLVRRCVPVITQHLHEFSIAEAQVRDNVQTLQIDALEHNSISDQFARNCRGGHLHVAAQMDSPQATSQHQQEKKLQTYLGDIVENLLPSLLPPSELSSQILKIILREILGCAMLLPIFNLLTDPDFWNQMIVTHAHQAIQERARVKRFRHVLKEQTQDPVAQRKTVKRRPTKNLEKLMRCNEPKDWERLYRKIKKSQSLADVSRMRSEMMILKNEMMAANYASDPGTVDSVKQTGKSDHYIIKAMSLLESRIATLSGGRKTVATIAIPGNPSFDRTLAIGVSYFLQYLEQRNRAELLDFWQQVVQMKLSSNEPMPSSQLHILDSTRHLSKEEIQLLQEKYFDNDLLTITESEKTLVRNYLTNEPDVYDIDSNEVIVSVARRAYRTLETEDFPDFKTNSLYFQMVTGSESSTPAKLSPPLLRSLSSSAILALGSASKFAMRNRSHTDLRELEHEYLGNETMGLVDTSELAVLEALDDALHDTLSADREKALEDLPPYVEIGNEHRRGQDGGRSPLSPRFSSDGEGQFARSHTASGSESPIYDLRTAEPGDLGIIEQIDLLDKEIAKRESSLGYIDSFLTRDIEDSDRRTAEKSRRETARELETLMSQKQQYAADDHSLYGRTILQIDHAMTHRDKDGNEYTAYMIEIRRRAPDGTEAGWIITRRYSEFNELLSQLKSRFPSVANLDFPKKQLNRLKSVAEVRRPILESFLRNLLQDERICQSRELRTFLSQNTEHVKKRQHKGVIENLLNMTDPREAFGRLFTMLEGPEDPLRLSANPDLRLVHPAPQEAQEDELSSFTKPIVDLILEAFDLRERSKWIKKRAVVLVLQQILGGTIESRVRDGCAAYTSPGPLAALLRSLKDQVRALGERQATTDSAAAAAAGSTTDAGKSKAERARTMDLARETLRAYNPPYVPETAAKKVFRALQHRSLNRHLLGRLIDQALMLGQ